MGFIEPNFCISSLCDAWFRKLIEGFWSESSYLTYYKILTRRCLFFENEFDLFLGLLTGSYVTRLLLLLHTLIVLFPEKKKMVCVVNFLCVHLITRKRDLTVNTLIFLGRGCVMWARINIYKIIKKEKDVTISFYPLSCASLARSYVS